MSNDVKARILEWAKKIQETDEWGGAHDLAVIAAEMKAYIAGWEEENGGSK